MSEKGSLSGITISVRNEYPLASAFVFFIFSIAEMFLFPQSIYDIAVCRPVSIPAKNLSKASASPFSNSIRIYDI